MNLVILAYLLPLLGIFTLSVLIFQRRKTAFASYFTFSSTFVAIAAWQLLQLAGYYAEASASLYLYRLSISVALVALASLLLYGVLYPAEKKFPPFYIVALIFAPVLAMIPLCFEPAMIEGVVARGAVHDIKTGPLYILHTAVSVAYVLVFFIVLLRKRVQQPKLKNVINSLILSFLIPLGVGFLFNFVFTLLFENADVFYLFPISLFATASIIAYSIVKHQLFDIRLAAMRSSAYLFALLTLSVIYFVIAYLVSLTLFQGETTSMVSFSPINIFLSLLLAFIFQPIKNFFDKATDKIFFRDRYDTDDFYARFSEVLTSTTELRKLLERAAIEIGTTLKAEQAYFFVQYDQRHKITAGTHRHTDFPVKDVDDLNDYIQQSGEDIIVRDSIVTNPHIQKILISHKIAILMPLIRHKEVIGYLCLGDQQATNYTTRDAKVLATISDELVIAIQNSLSIQEVRDINANLEQRIETATAELRTTNARLRRLDAAKDEFLSMASHQLRTPLTSVKGYLSMMLDGDMGEISPMQKKVLEEAFGSSERMVHLIHDFLNVSRLQTGKFMLELAEISLPKLIAEEVKSLEQVAKSRSMKLDFINNVGEMVIQLDDTKIRQVVMNYIDNAIYYSHPDSTITITLDKTDEQVQLRVKDTGIGVPKSEQEHLFGKFYRATNARKQRPDGTGVGIYLAKKVVTALGGDIIFDSKEGKGSTFGFWLPLK